jgi:hypothetical protein
VVTINNLDVRFEVETEDEATFARLFKQYIGRWHKQQQERQDRERMMERERSLGFRRREESQR